jgi:hypothetical protein
MPLATTTNDVQMKKYYNFDSEIMWYFFEDSEDTVQHNVSTVPKLAKMTPEAFFAP